MTRLLEGWWVGAFSYCPPVGMDGARYREGDVVAYRGIADERSVSASPQASHPREGID